MADLSRLGGSGYGVKLKGPQFNSRSGNFSNRTSMLGSLYYDTLGLFDGVQKELINLEGKYLIANLLSTGFGGAASEFVDVQIEIDGEIVFEKIGIKAAGDEMINYVGNSNGVSSSINTKEPLALIPGNILCEQSFILRVKLRGGTSNNVNGYIQGIVYAID